MLIKRRGIYLADLGKRVGSIQFGVRPVLIVGNNYSCRYSTVFLCVPLTSKQKTWLPTHYSLEVDKYPFLWKESNTILTEQIMPVEERQLLQYLGDIETKDMIRIETRLKKALGIFDNNFNRGGEEDGWDYRYKKRLSKFGKEIGESGNKFSKDRSSDIKFNYNGKR